MERGYAVDFDNIGACAADVRAHCVEEVCKVNNVRLLGGVFNYSKSPCLDCGKHNVNGCAHGNLVHINQTSGQTVGICVDHCVFNNGCRCAQKLKALYMQINRTDAEVAAAGKGNLCAAVSSEQRADEII